MKKEILFLGFFLMISTISFAQLNRYLIKFTDKGFNDHTINNPSAYLSQKAIARRQQFNISIDSTDLPITQRYLDSVRLSGNVTILSKSKWLNQVSIRTTDTDALANIAAFPFVSSVQTIASKNVENLVVKQFDPPQENLTIPKAESIVNIEGEYNYGAGTGQVRIHQGAFLHNLGFNGNGMQIAMLDAGYYHYETLPAFDSVRLNHQILGTWDFVNNEVSVNEDHWHGMMCLSSIAANLPGQLVGTAPGASFYLFRTEDAASEYPIEEHNWVSGLEKADSLGVEVSSTSLGYSVFSNSQFNHSYADMDGNSTMAAIGADLAAKKGMLVLVAAGNEGNSNWHYISTPADADSVLTVGAVDSLGNSAAFSGYGPSSDGDIKPGVAAVGWNAVVSNTVPGPPIFVNGTSFACPNMAGLATSLWQAFPEASNMVVIEALQQNASQSNSPDDRVGYGIPNMKKAFVWLIKKFASQHAQIQHCKTTIDLRIKAGKDMQITLQRKNNTESSFNNIDSFIQDGAFEMHDYQFIDTLQNEDLGPVSYRIQMTIGTDTSFVLDSMHLNFMAHCPATQNKVTIAPNPVTDFLQLILERTSGATVQVSIHNALGQMIVFEKFDVIAGTHTRMFDTRKLAAGMYFISVQIPNEEKITKAFLK